MLGIAVGVDKVLRLATQYFPPAQNATWHSMLRIYAFICIIVAYIAVNGFSASIFALTP
jgi:hypothetical protein